MSDKETPQVVEAEIFETEKEYRKKVNEYRSKLKSMLVMIFV